MAFYHSYNQSRTTSLVLIAGKISRRLSLFKVRFSPVRTSRAAVKAPDGPKALLFHVISASTSCLAVRFEITSRVLLDGKDTVIRQTIFGCEV